MQATIECKESTKYHESFMRPLKDLLIDQSKGRFLTQAEKKRIQKNANEQRIKNLNKKHGR